MELPYVREHRDSIQVVCMYCRLPGKSHGFDEFAPAVILFSGFDPCMLMCCWPNPDAQVLGSSLDLPLRPQRVEATKSSPNFIFSISPEWGNDRLGDIDVKPSRQLRQGKDDDDEGQALIEVPESQCCVICEDSDLS